MTRLGALTVVVIEDSPAPRAHLVRAREAEGHGVVGLAAGAVEAAGVVQRSTPDLVERLLRRAP